MAECCQINESLRWCRPIAAQATHRLQSNRALRHLGPHTACGVNTTQHHHLYTTPPPLHNTTTPLHNTTTSTQHHHLYTTPPPLYTTPPPLHNTTTSTQHHPSTQMNLFHTNEGELIQHGRVLPDQ
ncbi:unnamed protein product [Arctogadus glacialis]